jgi:probable phosphoglycerate mutase
VEHDSVAEGGGGAIYVLRHGATEWTRSGRHTSHTDVALTAEGAQQARLAGTVISALRATDVPPALVLSSPKRRAQRTAELAGLVVSEVTELLCEWDYGAYEGLTTEAIRREVPGWTVWTHRVPGGESQEAVHRRAERAFERVAAALPAGDVVLVGHGHFSRVLIATWLGYDASAGVRFALSAAGTSVLDRERGVPRLRMLNLPPAGPAQP